MRKTNKKLVNLMMAGVMAAGVIMAPASTFAAKTCSICGHKFDTYDGIVSSWYNRKDGVSQRIDIFENMPSHPCDFSCELDGYRFLNT